MLGNFPLSPRIHTLLLARNRVSSIQPTLANSIPNLTNLQLESNSLSELADLDPLASFPRLTHLVLRDNPVTKKEVSVTPTTRTAIDKVQEESEANMRLPRTTALPVLGPLALPLCAIPGLYQGEGCGAQAYHRAIWDDRIANGARDEDNECQVHNIRCPVFARERGQRY